LSFVDGWLAGTGKNIRILNSPTLTPGSISVSLLTGGVNGG